MAIRAKMCSRKQSFASPLGAQNCRWALRARFGDSGLGEAGYRIPIMSAPITDALLMPQGDDRIHRSRPFGRVETRGDADRDGNPERQQD